MPVIGSGGRVMTFLIESNKNDAEKCLISILWSIKGTHIFLHAPKGTAYKTAFFTDVVMPGLIEILSQAVVGRH
jgi:hypothetical protein